MTHNNTNYKTMKIKNPILTLFFLLFFSLGSNAQNYKPGEIYCRDKNTGKVTKISAELFEYQKKGKEHVKGLQYQLKDVGYDVAITGCIDQKTVIAYEANKKRIKATKKTGRKKARLARKKVKS